MSQILGHASPVPSKVTPEEAKGKTVPFVNIARSVFSEVGAIVMLGFLANRITDYFGVWKENNIGGWILGAPIGALLGLFVVFHLYLRKSSSIKEWE